MPLHDLFPLTRSSAEPFCDRRRFIHVFIQRSIDQTVKFGRGGAAQWLQLVSCVTNSRSASEINAASPCRDIPLGGSGADSLSRIPAHNRKERTEDQRAQSDDFLLCVSLQHIQSTGAMFADSVT